MSDNAPSEQKPNVKSARPSLVWPLVGSAVAIVAVVGLGVVGGISWKKLQLTQQQNQQQLVVLNDTITKLQQKNLEQQNFISKEREHARHALNAVASSNRNWQLAEAEYLIQLANFSVNFEQNASVATQLLEAADERIASVNNPQLLPVRQTLANNIAALKAVPKVDIPAILLQLNALGAQVAKLPVIATPNEVPQAPSPKHHHHQPGWKRGLSQSWKQLKQIIVVQYHNQPVGQLITPEKRNYLDLHLQMLLSQAEWACLHHESTLYSASLQQAIEWVKNDYVGSAPQTQAMLTSLQQLAQNNIAPALPDISGSLTAISTQMNPIPVKVIVTGGGV